MTTSRDVAREAGVSQPTVSRAMSGDPRISEETRRRVLEAARRLSYTPNAQARGLITRRTMTVGVVVADVNNPFYPLVLDVLHDELRANGYRMVLFRERSGTETPDKLIPLLLDRALDGVVFTTATLQAGPVETLVGRNLPVVLLNRAADDLDVDRVTSDNRGGGELAARFLATELGHRRLGLLAGAENTSTNRDREAGFRTTLQSLGLPLDETLRRTGPYSYETGYTHGRNLIGHKRPPTAIFCGNDQIALGTLDAARATHTRVPRDLSILGYDDVPLAAWNAFDLSTIRQPVQEMTLATVRLLLDRMLDPTLPTRTQTFPALLVRRGSTAPPRRP